MTTQEATHAPAGTDEEAGPFPTSLLETAPPLILDSEPTPFLESDPNPVLDIEPAPSPEVESESPLLLETAAPTIEYTPPSATPRHAATPKPARRADKNAPDPFAVGVRLLRMAPAWLLFTTVICGALVLVLGWVRGEGDAPVPPKQNDARAVQTAPKASAPAPKTAAADAPEVATPASVPAAAPVQNDAPAQQQPAQVAAPAPAEQTAPKAPEKAQAEPPAQAGVAGAKFTVQVGSHSDQSEANEQVSRLRAAGFEARSVAADLPGRGTWYRVHVGRFADRAEATKAAGQLRAKGAAAGAMVAPLQN